MSLQRDMAINLGERKSDIKRERNKVEWKHPQRKQSKRERLKNAIRKRSKGRKSDQYKKNHYILVLPTINARDIFKSL